MSIIVKTITRWVVGFIFLYGIYTVSSGHLNPGGGFAGGLILAGAYILIMLAYGKKFAFRNLDWRIARALAGIGGLIFLGLSVLSLVLEPQGQGHWLENVIQKNLPGRAFHLFNGGIIPLGNFSFGIMVLAVVFVVFALLSSVRLFEGRGGKFFQTMEDDK